MSMVEFLKDAKDSIDKGDSFGKLCMPQIGADRWAIRIHDNGAPSGRALP